MTAGAREHPEPDDVIDEFPMTDLEIHAAIGHRISRSRRRELVRALREAGLIVFRE